MLPSVKLYSRVLNYSPTSGASGSSRGGVPVATKCVVPKLTNHTLRAAKRLLLAAHCRLGKVSAENTSASRRGKVIGQNPKPGTHQPIHARVTVTLGERR
jgi:PASTA domain-containing protein